MDGASAWQIEAEDPLKLLLAVVVGGVIGLEREVRDKPAGFRTMILIALGSTLFTMFSLRLGLATQWDPGRIAAQIVTGVGFLGAGSILRDRRQVSGLTTAAAIWMVASLGIGVGMGQYGMTLAASAAAVLVLLAFARLERWMEQHRRLHRYRVGVAAGALDAVRERVRASNLRVSHALVSKSGDGVHFAFHAVGSEDAHAALVEALVAREDVTTVGRD